MAALKKNPEVLFFILLMIVLTHISADAMAQKDGNQQEILLWPKGAPDGPGPQGSEIITDKGSYTNISQPRLIVFHPQHPNGMAALVISGGGYAHIEIGKESNPASEWLQAHGITAFELIYRLPEEGWTNTAVAFQDGQRAMRIIRSKTRTFGIDPHKIGIIGFSAGGHLAGMIATQFDSRFYIPQDQTDQLSARPDFAAFIYPVITMLPPYDRTHSEKVLIGKHPGRQQQEAYSVQLHVNSQTPPTFLAQAEDDPISNVENSKLMYAALQQAGIASVINIFPTGGHGWGMGKSGTPETIWPDLFMNWMKKINIWQ